LSEIGGRFDFVSLINVFSHVPDFQGFMQAIKAFMAPAGELYIETANGGDLPSAADYPDALFLPDHLMFAGEETLKRYLAAADFMVTAERAERRDTALWMAKSAAKLMMGRHAKITIPYTSAYRIIMMRARRMTSAAYTSDAAAYQG
jgi:2-polyprenyl-3-methyl-5-hydroxy-6-metoxy-1,4-benzoquinol methylase